MGRILLEPNAIWSSKNWLKNSTRSPSRKSPRPTRVAMEMATKREAMVMANVAMVAKAMVVMVATKNVVMVAKTMATKMAVERRTIMKMQ